MTDKRWKAVERGAAAELNRVLSGVGKFTPVERIPLLGREGPDITVNEVGLVVNVKSRGNIPDRFYPTQCQLLRVKDLVCFRLSSIRFAPYFEVTDDLRPWKQLQDWYDWMDKWTKEFQTGGISTIFIHRPRMPLGNMGVVIHQKDLARLSCKLHTHSN